MSLFRRDREAEALASAQIEFLQRQLASERERYDALFEKYAQLRANGAIPEPPKQVDPTPVLMTSDPDDLTALIHARATSTRVRGMMLRQLAVDRANHRNEEDIQRDIENGYQSEGVPA